MIKRQDDFAQVCRRMQALMGEQPTAVRRPPMPRLDEMIQRLSAISAEHPLA